MCSVRGRADTTGEMTAPRTCRACGADLKGDVMWCLRCYEPVRQLTPREPQLPPLPVDAVVDPRSVRPDFAPLRVARPVYSRTRSGATSFGLLGRLAVTGIVVAMLPWGMLGPITLVYLLGYVPVALVVLRSTWAATPVDASRILTLPPRRTRTVLRVGGGLLGGAIAAAGVASGGSWLAAIPGAVLLFAAATPAWHAVTEGVAEMIERPITLLLALNVLNVVDVVASDAAIRAGEAAELNPFVGAIGTGIKLLLVAACSLLIHRLRPKALIWPTAAFLALAVYHLTGWLVMA